MQKNTHNEIDAKAEQARQLYHKHTSFLIDKNAIRMNLSCFTWEMFQYQPLSNFKGITV